MMGLDFKGKVFEERFLIADVVMKADFPSERWFWFDPPFHSGRSVLLHRQPDDVFRIDFQLAPDADPDVECRPESVLPMLRQMQIGRESCRERVCQYVSTSVVAVSFKLNIYIILFLVNQI